MKYFKQNFFQSYVIGANDISSFDNVELLLNHSVKVVLIEPHPFYFSILKSKYGNLENYTLINKAIHSKEKSMSLFSVRNTEKYEEWVKGISSFNKYHLIKNNVEEKDIESHLVHCTTIQNLFLQNLLLDIPIYLQIDVEGYDYEVFKGINFDKFNIQFLKIEIVNLMKLEVAEIKKSLFKHNFHSFIVDGDLYAFK